MVKSKNTNRSIRILLLIFACSFLVVIGRFVYIQWTGKANGVLLSIKAEEKQTSQVTIQGLRGNILDNRGDVLVEDSLSYDVIAILDASMTTNDKNPQHVVDIEHTASQLAPLLKMKEEEVRSLLSKDRFQVEFGTNGKNLTSVEKNRIEDLKLPGIIFREQYTRYYKHEDFASHVLGTVKQVENDSSIGLSGIEKVFNEQLVEKDGFIKQKYSRDGFLLDDEYLDIEPVKHGNSVKLTIDTKIQSVLEGSINGIEKKNHPKKVIAIISEAKTGRILAMSSRPSYNPNKNDITYFNNDAISYAYEPGSTMKIFTLASAIEEGVYKGDELFKSGSLQVKNSKPINDHNNGKGWGTITFDEGIQRSSNVAMSLLLQKMGTDTFYEYLEAFDLDKKTGIDLPVEEGSYINFKYERDRLSVGFGQSLAITPIQQIKAASAIANDGKMMQPFVVEEVLDSENNVIAEYKPEVVSQPISRKTAQHTLQLLETVVSSENGTGQLFNLAHYKVAGKTGTAQIYEDGRYLKGTGENIYSFMGFAPADDPKLIMYVAIQQPKLQAGETGGMLLSEIFNRTMQTSLSYLKVAYDKDPTATDEKKYYVVESFLDKRVTDIEKSLHNHQVEAVILGEEATVVAQIPLEGEKILTSEKVFLKTDGEITMPDLTNWSRREVLYLAKLL
ncbi:MAG: penicillin-binding transpeptidase domain-containing protein, partial [Bacillus sp. (in: firmicutes)]